MSARGLNVFVSIGAKLLPSINSTATQVERRFGRMSQRLRFHAAEIKATYKGLRRDMEPLVGLAAAGGLVMSARKVIGDSAHLSHELQLLRNAGRTSQEVAAAMAQANKTIAAVPTSTLTDNIKLLNETTGAFGSFQHALENLTFNQKVAGMLSNVLGDRAGDPADMFNNMVRGMEMRGAAQDHLRYQREVGQMYRAMVFTGGRFNPEEFLNYSQQANPYTKGMSLRFLSRIAPSLISEFGGDRAGTMQNTWMGTILGKAKNKISTEAWMKLGLLDPKEVVYNKVGPVGWRAGAIKGTDLAMQDPLAWSEKVLIPALRAQGVDTSNQLQLAKALMPLFRDRNANRLANALVNDLDRKRLHKDEGLIDKVPDVETAQKSTLRNDPLKAWAALTASLTNLSSVLFGTGKGESPIAVALVNIAKAINAFAIFLEGHPILAKGLGFALLGTAGLASLRVLGMGLGFALRPLKMFAGAWRFLFSSVGKNGPRVPFIKTLGRWLAPVGRFLAGIGRKIGPMLLRGLMRLGPLFLRGLMAVGPWLLRGLAAAFGLLSNPVGWAILAISVVALIWKFRKELMAAWNNVVVPAFANAWAGIKRWALSIDWKGIGWKIADALTFGLAGKLRTAFNNLPKPNAAALAGNVGMNAKGGGLAGMRAGGGGVHRGRRYLVGENGPEVFTPGSTGTITANRHLNGALSSGKGRTVVNVGGITINGATDPAAVAREVDRAIRRYADNSGNLSD